VLKVCSDILNATDQGLVTLLGLFDLCAAFDTVDHAILIESLHTGVGVGLWEVLHCPGLPPI